MERCPDDRELAVQVLFHAHGKQPSGTGFFHDHAKAGSPVEALPEPKARIGVGQKG